MKFKSNHTKLVENNGKYGVMIEVPINLVDELNSILKNENIEIEIYKEKVKRSLNANAYFWVICNKIAKLLDSTDEEIYLQMLQDYGVHKYFVCLATDVGDYKKDYKLVEVMNKVIVQTVKGPKDAIQVKCIRGSSLYDSVQMSRLIEGVINEAKILGIETLTDQEIKTMLNDWSVK